MANKKQRPPKAVNQKPERAGLEADASLADGIESEAEDTNINGVATEADVTEDIDAESGDSESLEEGDEVYLDDDEDDVDYFEDYDEDALAESAELDAEDEGKDVLDSGATTNVPADQGQVASTPVSALYTYVDGDEGALLNADDLYHQIQAFATQTRVSLTTGASHKELLKKAVALGQSFGAAVDDAESRTNGCIASYRIWQGRYFIQLQRLHKASKSGKWTDFVKENFKSLSLRSVQDYMRLAKVNNSQKWVLLGADRLQVLLRAIGKDNPNLVGDDPIHDYLLQNGFDFDPATSDMSMDEIRTQVNTCIMWGRLRSEQFTEIPREQVEAFVREGKEFSGKLLQNLKEEKKQGNDPVRYLESATHGKAPAVESVTSKVTAFNSGAENLLVQITAITSDPELMAQVNKSLIEELDEAMSLLKVSLASEE